MEVALGESVETDRGTVTVRSLDPVAEGTRGAPSPETGFAVREIRFRSCRSGTEGPLVDLSAFSVRTSDDSTATAAGSALSESSGQCTAGVVFVQVPEGATPKDVEYAADPIGVWSLR